MQRVSTIGRRRYALQPQPHVNENWESPPANLASLEGATQSDAAMNVRAADIAEANILIDMFVNG
jgi:hypothetical protein